jgi:Fic family protein
MKVPVTPPSMTALMKRVGQQGGGELMRTVLAAGLDPAPDGKYRHWDTLRHLKPPADITLEEWWFAIKLARMPMYKKLPLTDAGGRHFRFATPDVAVELLHQIDCDASGRIAVAEEVTNPATRDYYLVNSLMEEAITSSQLEGASTTHKVAKEMIRTGREPRDVPERMIFNNYRAMNHVRDIVKEEFTAKRLFELHSMLTDGTLANPDAAGRFRRADDPEEDIVVSDRTDGQTLHTPPPAGQLQARMEAMIDFANGKDKKAAFVHPVVRSILLHFWLAYDHPFVDGNGRAARALFYWSMLKHGYWLSEYLSISKILKKAPGRYSRAFLYTETDENDATYFLLFQMSVIRQAIRELHSFLKHKMAEIRATEAMIRNSVHFNHRQLALISHALKHVHAEYTMEGHARSHRVSHETARADLYDLERKKLLVRRKQGRVFYFSAVADLAARLKRL